MTRPSAALLEYMVEGRLLFREPRVGKWWVTELNRDDLKQQKGVCERLVQDGVILLAATTAKGIEQYVFLGADD